MTTKRRALGRGLAALIPAAAGGGEVEARAGAAARATAATGTATAAAAAGRAPIAAAATAPRGDGLRVVGIEEVHPAREQPRKTFDDARLDELAASIRAQGLIQPLVVRLREARAGGGYELIAGERRWRAAQRAGLHTVPVIVRDTAPGAAFELALVENLQREDLNAIEEAQGYEWLIREHGYSQESLAARVGRDRSTIANALRLLKLPASVRALVMAGKLSMGHARALLGLDSNDAIERLGRRIAARGEMSVRQVEGLVRRERETATAGADPAAPAAPAAGNGRGETASARDLALRLERALGMRVRVVEGAAGAGRLEIHFGSLDQLDSLLVKLLP